MSIEDYEFKDFDLDELSDGINSIVTRQNTKDIKLSECQIGRNTRNYIGFPRGFDCQAWPLPSSDEKAIASGGWTMIGSNAVNQLCLRTSSHNPCANT